jgi:hypothetical protein
MELYKVVYDGNDKEADLYGISIVDNPANQYEFITLSEYKELKLTSENKEKQLLTGVVLVPNQKILRGTPDNKLFEIYFEEEVIERLSQDFLKKGYQRNSTYNHDDDKWLDGTTIVESWIVEDPNNDKSNALGFKGLPKGTWMISMKLTDELWKEYIKTGKAKGFSIDSYIQLEKIQLAAKPPFHEFCKCKLVDGKIQTDGTPCDYCQEQINKLNLNKQKMKKNTTILASLSNFFSAIKTKITLSSFEVEEFGMLMADSMEVGEIVYQDVDGEMVPLMNAEFTFDGKLYKTGEAGEILSGEEVKEEINDEMLLKVFNYVKTKLAGNIEVVEEEVIEEDKVDVEALKSRIAELEKQLEDIMKDKEDVLKENVELKKYTSTRLKSNESKSFKSDSTLEALRKVINTNK